MTQTLSQRLEACQALFASLDGGALLFSGLLPVEGQQALRGDASLDVRLDGLIEFGQFVADCRLSSSAPLESVRPADRRRRLRLDSFEPLRGRSGSAGFRLSHCADAAVPLDSV